MADVELALAQAVELPDFTGLPGYAQGILYTVLAIGLALSVIIPRFGFLYGRDRANAAPAAAQVAAVIVDPTALNAHTAAINKLAEVLDRRMEGLISGLDDIREQMVIDRETRRK